MIQKHAGRFALILSVLSVAGCGNGNVLILPDDCLVFTSRAEALALYNLATAERNDGSSELEAFGVVLAECLRDNCDGESGGVCAVSCASCTDALVTVAYQ